MKTSSWMSAAVSVLVLGSGAASVRAGDECIETPTPVDDAGIFFVPDVEDQFAKLALRPEALGFDIGSSPNPSQAKHYQGMVRLQGAGTPYLFVARSGNCPGFFGGCQLEDDDPGNLLIVKMASRDTTGERMRSNRLKRGEDIDDTRPDFRDATVSYISFDGSGVWPAWGHPGGMQMVGDVLAVPLETRYPNDCDPNCETAGGEGQNLILFLDVSDPENPVETSRLALQTTDDWSAGLVGLTPILNDEGGCCNHLLLITGAQGKVIRIYGSVPTDPVADTTDLADPWLTWQLLDERTESEIEVCLGGEDWHTGLGDSHQTLNFVRQASMDGPLYLIGARNTTLLPGGEDWLDLYLFDEDAVGDAAACLFTHRDSTHFTSKPIMGGGDSANFAAAGGVYVSPSGELMFYSAEYDNDGPDETVRFGEWRHREVVRTDSPTLRPTVTVGGPFQVDEGSSTTLSGVGQGATTKAWLMLFEDDGVGLGLELDKDDWLMADYADWSADDFDDFREEDYSDDAGSWRWFAPVGCSIRANDDDFGDSNFPGADTKTLPGTGQVEEEHDLDQVQNDDGDPSMDDAITSMQFFANCSSYYGAAMDLSWDLDDDGSFETAGSSPTFSAAGLDGPTCVAVPVRAQHPSDATALGSGAAVDAQVQVVNVAPTASAGPDFTADEAEALSRSFSFFDPGAPDTHTAEADWGDEIGPVAVPVTETANATTGTVASAHTYGDDGVYSLELCVVDDDDGVGCDTAIATVANLDPQLTLDTGDQVHFPGGGDAFLGRRGEAHTWSAGGADPGSDDLEFSWALTDTYFGGDLIHADSAYYCNDPDEVSCPDLALSSQRHHFPMQVSDSTGTTPSLPGVFRLDADLADDDGGTAGDSSWLVVTDDRTCTETRSTWRRDYDGKKPATIDPGLLDRYLHVVEFASTSFSEVLCPALHDTACLRDAVVDLLSNNGVAVGADHPSRSRGKALAEVVAAWLNFASGAILWDDELEPAGALFHQAMTAWEATIADPSTEHLELVQVRLAVRALNQSRPCGPK